MSLTDTHQTFSDEHAEFQYDTVSSTANSASKATLLLTRNLFVIFFDIW